MPKHSALRKWPLYVAVVLATVGGACARDTTAPVRSVAPFFRADIDHSLFSPQYGQVRVCNFTKLGLPGAGTYVVNVNGVDGSPFTLVNDEDCTIAWQATGDGQATIKVTQIGPNCTIHLSTRQLDATGSFSIVFDGVANSYTGSISTVNGLSSTGYSIWFKNTECNPPPPQTCTDQSATNYGGPLPCVYPPPPDKCTDQSASNYGGPLPCVYPGKTFTIGPSSMEGAILISNGDWVNGGYSFKFKSSTHLATNFTVNAFVTLTGPCIGGGPATDTFSFPLNGATYAVPAGNTNWLPTGDANSVLSWQGSVQASGICGGIGKLDARKGAVFTATVSQNPPSGSLVDFRFKYRDPAAKGKPNTNCLDTSDPNRAKADVCGASWSQTVTDP